MFLLIIGMMVGSLLGFILCSLMVANKYADYQPASTLEHKLKEEYHSFTFGKTSAGKTKLLVDEWH